MKKLSEKANKYIYEAEELYFYRRPEGFLLPAATGETSQTRENREKTEHAAVDDKSFFALKDINLKILKGSRHCICGANGSGKSTFAGLLNALELPDRGRLLVLGKRSDIEENIYELRRISGMVFQNPDNQIVGTTVEEDCAFGPENLALPPDEITKRVDESLRLSGLSEKAKQPTNRLSGGQKQKLAIAGILAMRPEALILDEATAMLDPQSAKRFSDFILELQAKENLTVVEITHDMNSAASADCMTVLRNGEILANAEPHKIFADFALIKENSLELPLIYDISAFFDLFGLPDKVVAYDFATALDAVYHEIVTHRASKERLKEFFGRYAELQRNEIAYKKQAYKDKELLIEIKDLSCTYSPGTLMAKTALNSIDLEIRKGGITAVCGATGSGKTTLINHLNALIIPEEGEVRVFGISSKQKKRLQEIRRRVGLLFQYAEMQFFSPTVAEDVAYGAKIRNLIPPGVSDEEYALKPLQEVGLDAGFLAKSPFQLSGGEKRRVALAGVLASNPEILVLDEPAAGLDPKGRREMNETVLRLRDAGKTIVFVSHNMNEVAAMADRVVLLKDGFLIAEGETAEIFADKKALSEAGSGLPDAKVFLDALAARVEAENTFLTLAEFKCAFKAAEKIAFDFERDFAAAYAAEKARFETEAGRRPE